MKEATNLHMTCPFTDYPSGMPTVRRTTQHTIGVENNLWSDCVKIARAKHTRLAQVIRDFLVDYRAANADLLAEIKANEQADST